MITVELEKNSLFCLYRLTLCLIFTKIVLVLATVVFFGENRKFYFEYRKQYFPSSSFGGVYWPIAIKKLHFREIFHFVLQKRKQRFNRSCFTNVPVLGAPRK
jgi:hypothetical protein